MSNGSAPEPGRPARVWTAGATGPSARATRSSWPTRRPGTGSGAPIRAPCSSQRLAVGLPEGQMGNSEVGHLNLGAGRVVPQDLVRISQSIQSGEFFRAPALCRARAPRSGRPAARSTSSACSGPAACTRSTGTSSPASSSACGTTCRASPSTDSSTAATPRPRWAPRWCGRCCTTCGGSPADAGRRRLAHRPLLRRWTATSGGSAPSGLRRDGPRHRHRGRPSGAGGAGGLPARRDRRVHPAARAPSQTARRWRRCATATASSASTIAATGCGRSWRALGAPRTSTGSISATGPALDASP